MFKLLFSWVASLLGKKDNLVRSSAEFYAESSRSHEWRSLSSNFLNGKKCAICGSFENLEAHHKKAFHEHPELELDISNLVALCRNPSKNCHFVFGHLMNWSTTNHDIDNTIKYFQLLIKKAKMNASRRIKHNSG